MTDYKNLKLRASSNPHIRNGEDTRGLMLDVIIALMPALLFGVWHFGVRVAISAVVSVASAIFFEWLYRKLLHKPQMNGDLSSCSSTAAWAKTSSTPRSPRVPRASRATPPP